MTDTMSSTPESPRPQPGSEQARPQQRFRLPGAQPSAAGVNQAAARPTGRQSPPLRPSARPASPNGPAYAAAPDGRYGEKQGMSRSRKMGLGIVGLALLGGVGGYIAWQLSHPTIQGTVTSFNATSATSVLVTFEVDKPADKNATCTLEAIDGKGSVIGTASVPILSGRAKNVQTYTLQTTTTANTVSVQNCKLTN